MDPYVTIKIKRKTAEDFRRFSRELVAQQSECLQLMLDFFRNYQLSPRDELGPQMTTLEKRIKTRINALIAILKDIEKTQTKPTFSMLQLLFQESPVRKKELLLEKNSSTGTTGKTYGERSAYPSPELELRKKLLERTQDLNHVLEKVVVNRSSFGSVYLRLNMSKEEFEQLKHKLQNQQ